MKGKITMGVPYCLVAGLPGALSFPLPVGP
jgi:hypothetical protein